MELRGKAALVTGGGTGLGKVISLKLAREGADVAVVYSKSAAEAEQTVGEIRALGRRALAIRADVSRESDVQAMVDEVVRGLGRLDVLVNDAGYTVFVDFKQLADVTEEAWDRIMDVNVKGAFLCSRAVAPHMRARGKGAIVNVTSVSGVRAGGSSIAYSVSKAGETMLTKCLAMSLAPEIAVNAVAPGLMDTRWGRLWGDEAFERNAKNSPLQHIPTLDDISDTVLFLLKNDSMTGQSIVVDSGGFMH
jgi:3-oxoacyl-[acyl-carrier protein] reductase